MNLYCQQLVDGEAIDPEWLIAPVPGIDYPVGLLHVKAASADEKGWDVEWLGPDSFVARMVRWGGPSMCERIFRVGP